MIWPLVIIGVFMLLVYNRQRVEMFVTKAKIIALDILIMIIRKK